MDGLKPGRGNYSRRPHARPSSNTPVRPSSSVKARHAGEKYWLVRSLGKVASKQKKTLWAGFKQTEFAKWPDKNIWQRVYALLALFLFLLSVVAGIVQPYIDHTFYNVSPATRQILPKQSDNLAKSLVFKAKEEAFLYNEGYKVSTDQNSLKMTGTGSPRFSASFSKNPSKGVSLTDPVNNTDVKLIPKFSLASGKQDKNQVFYPLGDMDGYLVYTAQTASVKEDIVLQSKPKKDKLVFDYELQLPDGLEARIEKNGSIGVYGSNLPLYGNVATGSDKDIELLQKAKQNAEKTKFLFGIPAPVIKEFGKDNSNIAARFELNGKNVKLTAENLKAATYPLTIDPSIYIQSAAQLMYGNNETNVEFDVATEQFKKGTTTGARINKWTGSGAMNDATYDQSVVTSGGYVYRAGGRSGRVIPYIADSQTTVQTTATTNISVSMPANRPTGAMYIVVLGFGTDSGISVVPTGWAGIASASNRTWTYYYSGNTAQPATVSWTASGNVQYSAVVYRIGNADTATAPLGASRFNAANTVPTFNGVIPTQDGALIIGTVTTEGDVPAARGFSPAGYTDITSLHNTGVQAANTAGLIASTADSPPRSGVSSGAQATNMPSSAFAWGSVTIAVYGVTATAAYQNSLQWAHFNTTNGSIDSPAPGSNNAACTNWCTNSAYNLPNTSCSATNCPGLVGTAMVAYNGYLYLLGGYDGTYIKSTVYIAKLGSNGEPQLWHPSSSDQTQWAYWYKDAGLSGATALQYLSAYAYNGKMYVLGGDGDASNNTTGAVTTVKVADILPNGTLGTWSNGQSLLSARYGASVQGYNGYLYIIGGNSGSATLKTVEVSRLNSDGTMNSWQTAAADGTVTLTNARTSMGGVMSGIWGGYIYVAGGCNVVNASGYCTTINGDMQIASINADGTLDSWNTMSYVNNKRIGSSFIAWQDSLYRFGGCSDQDATTGFCYATYIDVQYGNINQDGDASTVSISQPSGSGNCIDPDPYNCDLPSGEGQMLSSSVILNGYLYSIGGCTNANCASGNFSGDTVYAAIDSSGRLKSPPTCSGTVSGAWCTDSTNTIAAGIGASGATVFGGKIYLVGGQDGSGNGKKNIYRNTVNADGSLSGAWVTTTFTTAGLTALNSADGISYTYVYARANPASAGTNPGNLYIFGGCGDPATGAGCGTNSAIQSVYKCNIATDGSINTCSTNGQEPIGTVTGGDAPGLAIHAGTVYANYIYLIGGVGVDNNGVNTALDLKYVRYAKFDNNNNVVGVNGSGTGWTESSVLMEHGRRRGTALGYNGYLYAVGGYDANSSQILDTIEFVKINVSDGSLVDPGNSKFTQSAVTFNQRWGLSMVVSNSYAYLIGGCKAGDSPTCTTLDSTVQTFQVYNNDSGAPGGYTPSANLYATNRIGASAAVMNGYMYIAGGCTNGTDCTTTQDVQKAPIDANGAVGAWTSTGNFGSGKAYGQLEVAGGTLYYVGGENVGSASTEVLYATMGASGAITAWNNASNNLPAARTQVSATVWNNRIYVTGGYSTGPTTYQNTVYVSPQLNSGGNITSAWTTTTGFNVARAGHVAIAYANNLYILSGYNGTNYLSDVQYAKIDSSTGAISGSWTYSTNLPYGLRQADGFASNGYMYLFGGRTSTNDCTARTLIAPISANTSISSGNNPTGIGEWYQTNRNFDGGRYGAAAVNYQGKAYVLGGGCQGIVMQDDFDDASSPYYDASQWASINAMQADTKCQSTSSSKTLSGTTGGTGAGSAIATTKSVDVSSGGTVYFKLYEPLADITTTGGTCYKGESTTSLLTTTRDEVQLQYSLSPYSSWTLIGSAYTYNQQDPFKTYAVTIPAGAFSAATRFRWLMPNGAATDSFALEDVSIIATGNTTISYPADTVTQTALLSQPQVAIYSRLVDAGNDAFPKKFLINGIDNSIGARWQMLYRSMNDTTNTANPCGGSVMTGYGALTNFGDVTLGTPGTYTMKNSAGTDIGCGRYFFMTVSIDASQTYGYPDDITRGPTLDNLTLFYNSNPGKRLIHGKTFTEGIQQPLDTQP